MVILVLNICLTYFYAYYETSLLTKVKSNPSKSLPAIEAIGVELTSFEH